MLVLEATDAQIKAIFYFDKAKNAFQEEDYRKINNEIIEAKIRKLGLRGIKRFLNYQYSKSNFKNLLLYFISEIASLPGSSLSKEEREKFHAWAKSKVELSYSEKGRLDRYLFEYETPNSLNMVNWEKTVQDLILTKNEPERQQYLEYAENTIYEILEIHKIGYPNDYSSDEYEVINYKITQIAKIHNSMPSSNSMLKPSKESEESNQRRILALLTLLYSLDGFQIRHNISALAKFFTFLIGNSRENNRKNISNASLLSKGQSKLDGDVKEVKEFFEKIGLEDLAKLVEKVVQKEKERLG